MSEERRNSAGVVRAMARSCPGRWVAIPRGARAASHGPAMVQRRPPQGSRCSGVCSRAGANQAGGLPCACGAWISPQRRATGGVPVGDHPAVSGAIATSRGPSPSHGATIPVLPGVLSAVNPASSVGRRWPGSRGRPGVPGARGGGGSERAAARRRRVSTRPRGKGVPWFRSSSTATRLSATKTLARPGHQRTTSRSLCHARAVQGCWRRPRCASKRAEGPRTGSKGRTQTRSAQARGARTIPASPRSPLTLTQGGWEDRTGSRAMPCAWL
jgi:hypothetical protein